jgi:hypothetical protein
MLGLVCFWYWCSEIIVLKQKALGFVLSESCHDNRQKEFNNRRIVQGGYTSVVTSKLCDVGSKQSFPLFDILCEYEMMSWPYGLPTTRSWWPNDMQYHIFFGNH